MDDRTSGKYDRLASETMYHLVERVIAHLEDPPARIVGPEAPRANPHAVAPPEPHTSQRTIPRAAHRQRMRRADTARRQEIIPSEAHHR